MKKKILLYGGSFDPFHYGHRNMFLYALQMKDIKFDEALVYVSDPDQWKPENSKAPWYARYDIMMRSLSDCQNIFDSCGTKLVSSVYVNSEIRQCYAWQVVDLLRDNYDPYFLIGEDCVRTMSMWVNFKRLNEKVTFIVAGRENLDDEQYELSGMRSYKKMQFNLPISSTEIRKMLKEEEPNPKLELMLGAEAYEFIKYYNLYKD